MAWTVTSFVISTALVILAMFGCRHLGLNQECPVCCDVLIIVSAAGLVVLKKYVAGGSYSGKETIQGKTVIITGANTGIGLETAKELAKRGGRVILACRDVARGEEARKLIVDQTGNENVLLKKLDLASFASIKAFSTDINETESRVDILINNAGVMMCELMQTQEGIELQLGINHIGHFLLTQLLLDKIKASAPSRIINVSSRAHRFGRINFDDLNSKKSYNRMAAYGQSKLANILHARELSSQLEGSGVTVNSLHPGAVDTELYRHIPLVYNWRLVRLLTFPFRYFLFKTPVEGAQTTLRLALDPALETVTGKYFCDCQVQIPAAQAEDDQTAKRLWNVSVEWVKGNID